MKINCRFTNVLAWGSNPVEIDLNQTGLTLIKGKHLSNKTKSTNGVGKSTILDSVSWGVFGEYPSGRKKKDMVNDNANGKNCLSECWVSVGTKEAYIARGINCDEATYSFKDSKEITLAGDFLLFFIEGKDCRGATTKDTQNNIIEYLRIDYDSFLIAGLFTSSQESFASKTSGKQEEILSKLLHLEELDLARKKVSNEQKVVKDDITNCDIAIDKFESHIVREKQRLERAKSVQVEWEKEKQGKLESLERRKDSSLIEKDKLEDVIEATIDELEDAEDVLEDLQDDLKEFNEAELNDNKQTANTKLRELDTEIGGYTREISNITKEVKQAQSMRGTLTCPKCFNEVTEEHLYDVIEEKNEKVDELNDKVEELQKTREEALKRLNKAEDELRQVNSKRNEIVAQKGLVGRLTSRKESNESSLKREEESLQDILRRIEKLEKETLPAGEDSESIEIEITKLENDIDAKNVEKDKLQIKLADLDFWYKGYGPSGIRNLLIRSVIPELNEHANRFAELLTDGELQISFTGETEVGSGSRTQSRNKVGFEVLDRFGSDSYDKESAGERRRIDLCVNLAMNFLVSKRVGMPFMIQDEIFLSLDTAGKNKVMELLYDLKKDIPSIFVISNSEDIVSESFDNYWTVIREGNESWLEKE